MSSFQVTTPNARLRTLKAGEFVEIPFAVANISNGACRGSFKTTTNDAGTAQWYSIKGAPASDFLPGATQPITVVVAVPIAASPKDAYSFRLFVGRSAEEDTDFTVSPDVTYAVAATAKPKGFPWWVAVAALVAIVAGVLFAVSRKDAGMRTAGCAQGYVWRESAPDDAVCVTPSEHDATLAENKLADARRNPAGGAFGPATCLSGFRWREAFVGDTVCVTGEQRIDALTQNSAGPSHRSP